MGLILPLTRLLSALPPVFWPLSFCPGSFPPCHLEDEWILVPRWNHQGQFPSTTSAPLRVHHHLHHNPWEPTPCSPFHPTSSSLGPKGWKILLPPAKLHLGFWSHLPALSPPREIFLISIQIVTRITAGPQSLVCTKIQTAASTTNCKTEPQHGPAAMALLKGSLRALQVCG